MTLCSSCLRAPSYATTRCKTCFIELFEKRLKKALRNTLVPQDRRLVLINDQSAGGIILLHFLKELLSPTNRTLAVKDRVDNTLSYDKLFLPTTREDYLESELNTIFITGAPSTHAPTTILLLSGLGNEEIEAFAKAKGYPFTTRAEETTALDHLEKKRPGVKETIAKALKELQ